MLENFYSLVKRKNRLSYRMQIDDVSCRSSTVVSCRIRVVLTICGFLYPVVETFLRKTT